MFPTKIESQPRTYQFSQLGRRQVAADFSGGQITSDGGLVLIAQLDRHYGITKDYGLNNIHIYDTFGFAV